MRVTLIAAAMAWLLGSAALAWPENIKFPDG
jgi:hypothetical protein